MDKLGTYAVPVTVGLIVLFGLFRHVPVFDAFMSGAKEGLSSSVSILPPLVGLITAVTMLKASGALDLFSAAVAPVAHLLGIPEQVVPLTLLRPISGSGSLAFVSNILENNGPDSFAGRVASVMMGSTETTFYAIAVYFGAIGVKRTRHTIPAALAADATGFIMSAVAVGLFFG